MTQEPLLFPTSDERHANKCHENPVKETTLAVCGRSICEGKSVAGAVLRRKCLIWDSRAGKD